jgi:hypothetical protein
LGHLDFQYTYVYRKIFAPRVGIKTGVKSSDAYDNAMAESFFATLECELLDRRLLATSSETRRVVFAWIEGWYNSLRRHSALGYLSPNALERRHVDRERGSFAPTPPFMTERRGDQAGPGFESGELSTEMG